MEITIKFTRFIDLDVIQIKYLWCGWQLLQRPSLYYQNSCSSLQKENWKCL